MNDTIRLEVPASASFFPVVRMVVGGAAARADLRLDQLQDLQMALEELLRAAHGLDEARRYAVIADVADSRLTVRAGLFRSGELRDMLLRDADHNSFDLTHLLAHMVHSLDVRDDGDGFWVAIGVHLGEESTSN
ncbi:MAG TPA: hypothetical protein VJ787_01990 [Thermoleophilia bacterium]|nr:hypothetical protein [Thermoleophilia bacterium]